MAERDFDRLLEASSVGSAVRQARFGESLKKRRESYGVSATDAARWARLDPDRLAVIEAAGDATDAELEALEAALSLAPGMLKSERPA